MARNDLIPDRPRRYVGAVLSGQPTKEVSFTAGMAPVKVDPNGQFEIEQMYVQYFKLAICAADVARRRPHRGHLGD
jgi:hypothetical protein